MILGPFYIYSTNKRDKLQGQLATANERISELSVYEERQRIARDLHDTLGQKLSMVGLKSDLAIRLVKKIKMLQYKSFGIFVKQLVLL